MTESKTAAQVRRSARIQRSTQETSVDLSLEIGPGQAQSSERVLDVPDGFFAHMLDALTKHAGLGITLRAKGDTHVDLHHTVEDTGLALGEALNEALGDRAGIVRFAHAYAPLDEALCRAVIDLSGRGFLCLRMPEVLQQAWVTRDFPLTLVEDFLQAFADRGRFTLHVDVLEGRNPHHVAESVFKAVALALRQAIAVRVGDGAVPSTKGTLNK